MSTVMKGCAARSTTTATPTRRRPRDALDLKLTFETGLMDDCVEGSALMMLRVQHKGYQEFKVDQAQDNWDMAIAVPA